MEKASARVEHEAELAALKAVGRVLNANPDEYMRKFGAGDTFGEDPNVTAARRAAIDARADGTDAAEAEAQYHLACLVVAHGLQRIRSLAARAVTVRAARDTAGAETAQQHTAAVEHAIASHHLARTGVVHAALLASHTRTQRVAAAHKAAA